MTSKKGVENFFFRRCILYRDTGLIASDELTLYLQEVQRSSGNVTEMIPEDVLAYEFRFSKKELMGGLGMLKMG